ncbi:DUF3976 domain-containing protein [Scopulibacillus daqui]|uniref:DUF3976 domain-containing protein n=1 Tax=Scopulibacillus daqui TaxID=1469162 RepID=UPI00195FCC7B|nr:DUF3976 domain-containing protein [Scopulibacillus daqui]
MGSFYAFLIFLTLFILLYLFIRKDFNQDKSLTKKGFIKLMTVLVIVFIGTVAAVCIFQ